MEGKLEKRVCFECTKYLPEPHSGNVIRLKRLYCGECWIKHCDFRFRKRLFELGRPEKGSKLDPNSLHRENVLLEFTGSSSSIALLYLIRDTILAMDTNDPVKRVLTVPFNFSILYIYDIVSETEVTNLKHLEFLREWQRDTHEQYKQDFPLIVSSLETSLQLLSGSMNDNSLFWKLVKTDFDPPASISYVPEQIMEADSLTNAFPFNAQSSSNLTSLTDNFKSATSKQDFIHEIRQNVITNVAKQLDVKKIIIAEDQTSMAVKMFSIMSLGRGAQLANQMSLVTETRDIKLARPLLDMTHDDLKDYLRCIQEREAQKADERAIKSGQLSSCTTDKGKKPSRVSKKTMHQECKDFVESLQQNYPATVPTLTRIGCKLRPAEGAPLLPCDGQTKNLPLNSEFPQESLYCSFCQKTRFDGSEFTESRELNLCYGCTNLLLDMKNPSLFRELLKS